MRTPNLQRPGSPPARRREGLAACLVLLAAAWMACRPTSGADDKSPRMAERLSMVETQIRARGVRDGHVIEAMRKVPRHEFVPDRLQREAYGDHPLPIGEGQTISQPYIVAFMTELAAIKPGDKVLEIGTGSGYQAAVLWAITTNVYTIEIVKPLYEQAREKLVQLGLPAANIRLGDGYQGWPEQAPFDAILVTAAPEKIPPPLLEQLKPGGRMVIPVGSIYTSQELQVVTKNLAGITTVRDVLPVRFVPLTRERGK
jgi:protein-L-isoaspartate(D-aspartate) O-methyltransferase